MNRAVTNILPVTELTVGPVWDGHQGNWDDQRTYPIDRIIIHTMDGTVQSANSRFNDPISCVSAHYGIGLNGQLFHWVDEELVAYHSGDYAMNQRSIGIEHEDDGNYNGQRTDQLYQTSGKLVADLCIYYNIPCDRQHILKHSEVSDHPTGCPDALDIDRIIREALGVLHPPKSSPSPSISPSSSVSPSISASPSPTPSEGLPELNLPVSSNAETGQVSGVTSPPEGSVAPISPQIPVKTPSRSLLSIIDAFLETWLKALLGVKNQRST